MADEEDEREDKAPEEPPTSQDDIRGDGDVSSNSQPGGNDGGLGDLQRQVADIRNTLNALQAGLNQEGRGTDASEENVGREVEKKNDDDIDDNGDDDSYDPASMTIEKLFHRN